MSTNSEHDRRLLRRTHETIAGDISLIASEFLAGFLLNLINLMPVAILDGGHVLRSWRVLRAGGGAATPDAARRRARIVAVASAATAAALVAGMVAAHVPQSRL